MARSQLVPLVLLAAGACTPAADSTQEESGSMASTPAWPEGAALVVGDEVILAEDIEAWVDTVALIEPSHTRQDHLRKALTNLVLHTRVARQVDRTGWAQARQRAERALEDLRAGRGVSPEGPAVQDVSGCWNDAEQDIGLDRWGRARDWAEGEWQMLETLGGWTVARVLDKPDEWLPNSNVALQHVTYYYLEPSTVKRQVEEALERLDIEVIDPAYEEVLPVWYRHLKKAGESLPSSAKRSIDSE